MSKIKKYNDIVNISFTAGLITCTIALLFLIISSVTLIIRPEILIVNNDVLVSVSLYFISYLIFMEITNKLIDTCDKFNSLKYKEERKKIFARRSFEIGERLESEE